MSMRIAVLGCGSIGSRHLRNLAALGQADLLAFDPSPAARASACEESGAYGCGTLGEVWARGPSAVVVAAPTDLHAPLALEAARRGCHLFVEKPLSHSADLLRQLCAEAGRRGLVTMVGCNMRFHPGPATVRRLVHEGRVGRVISARIQSGSYLPRWRPRQDYRESYSASPVWGGAALDCVHEIDLALWYFGPARVVGSALLPASAIGLETDGLAEILLRHECGVLSSVHVNFVQRDYRRGCQVVGTEGTLYWDFGEGRVTVHGGDGEPSEVYSEPEGWDPNRMYLDEMEHFIRSAEAGRQTVNPVEGGWEALNVVLAVRSAAQ